MDNIPIKTQPSASKDIDPITIRRLYHEEGMTIKAVAELCGISVPTVRRYLGPVGRRKSAVPKPVGASVARVGTAATPAPVHAKQLIRSKTEFRGLSATFEIDHESSALYVRGATFELLMSRAEIEQFIWELVEAYESIPKPKAAAGEEINVGD